MRILIAEDEAISRRLLQRKLEQWGYDVVAAVDGTEAWAFLQEPDAPRMAVLDWVMPGLDGPEICRRVREVGREPYTYLILLTRYDEKDKLVVGMHAGADDFLTKPFDDQELEMRLRAGRRIIELQEQLIATREALRRQATRDPLTEVYNRRAILERLGGFLDRARREGHSVGALLVDLDHFKRVNDTYGHLAGDAVLREAARRMGAMLRAYDVVGRYGGEEFLVVVPGVDAATSLIVADRLRDAISRTPIDSGEGKLTITCSVGVAISSPGGPLEPEALIQAADRALYRAKADGRDRVRLAE
jgi:diguanylate cyclase (GGDEF)-like protein